MGDGQIGIVESRVETGQQNAPVAAAEVRQAMEEYLSMPTIQNQNWVAERMTAFHEFWVMARLNQQGEG